MNTQTNENAATSIVDTLTSLGGEWARFGLEIGAQAIERSARTLTLAAKSLSAIAEALPKPTPSAAAPAEAAAAAPVDAVVEREVVTVEAGAEETKA